jgi:hypothetical protein
MSLPSRVFLIFAAWLCGGFVTLQGDGFSHAVDPELYSASTLVFWLFAGALAAMPLWLPALVPARFSRFLTISRRLGAVTLLIPSWLFGSIVVLGMQRTAAEQEGFSAVFFMGAALGSICLISFVILLWPDLRPGKRVVS